MMFDVVIVGGGPVGLFLACELKLAGVDPVVLERLPRASQADKAHGLAGQVVRLLDHRGLFERSGGGRAPTPIPTFYFGAMPLPLHVLGPDNPMYFLRINQRDLERVLGERAAELGVEVRRGYEVSSLAQSEDHVDLVAVGPDGGPAELSARFVVGCDGGHSLVRKQAGIAFPGIVNGEVVSRTALIAPTAQFTRPAAGGSGYTLGQRVRIEGFGEIDSTFHRTERGVISIGLFDPEHPIINTIEWEERPAGDSPGAGTPMTLAEMEASIERILGARVSLAPPPDGSPTLLRRLCGRNTRLAQRYRDHRVFLAGDAAHVHAASGGPGLNLGLQDAANLAWKLAAELRGWAPDRLLDSYESERRALGQRVFMQSQAQTALMAPGSAVTALRELLAEMLSERGNLRLIADLLAGSDIRYDMGESDPAATTGRFAPSLDLVTEDGRPRRLAELCREARPLLLDLSGGTELVAAVSPWSDRVVRVAARTSASPLPALLIRPDGYVAWTGTDPDGLQAALGRWFGVPSGAPEAPERVADGRAPHLRLGVPR
ncbi:FAD-dependent monooxygenase [Catenuloplanes atrovinosus]|uniref:2-polyprenyl-6-methoxyphenol hydroxylase-like FAD-dependent oxidoreductase n=1 Tax=Catenuloplanes atrovinosus TaxID=137266 RepID=A0AAE3YK10_9ACTN|nr:FAD-dependent monooxygenase [Catenuloplanes atrovinosus]MDR7273588.1 2-polyprenyl-6-methoxyphenol hydroxylase-like FAD-dependent oxidoreductase [Catenuloplanes atrovinosus]